MASGRVIDQTIITDLSGIGGSRALLDRVLGLFEAKVPQAVEGIERLAMTADRSALADAAHALKSMCSNIGAERAAIACDDLEKLARSSGDFDAASGAARIAREVAEVLRAVQQI